ncbi:MAG: hypothetical protein JW846_01700 [Dehalococcoidia bacterium]|nr:hypothetical protein [Dehalococcoidia bacterium]
MREVHGEAKRREVAAGHLQNQTGLLLALAVGIAAATAMHFGLFHSL